MEFRHRSDFQIRRRVGRVQAIKRAIFLTTESPYPTDTPGKVRDSYLIEALLREIEVEVLCHRGQESIQIPTALKISVIEQKPTSILQMGLNSLRPFIANGFSEEIVEALQERFSPGTLLWVSRLSMAKYIPLAKKMGYRIILDQHRVESNFRLDVGLLSRQNLSSVALDAQVAYYENQFCTPADVIVATNGIDAVRFTRTFQNKSIQIIPYCVPCAEFSPLRETEGENLVFSAPFDVPDIQEGLQWFEKKVKPKLKSVLGDRLPLIQFINSKDGLSSQSILKDAKLVFIPIRRGHSHTHFILEAMAAGRAVVTTSRGAEGLLTSPSYDIWVCESSDGFASALVRLIENEHLRKETAHHAAETAENRYDTSRIHATVSELIKQLSQFKSIAGIKGKSPVSGSTIV